MIEGLKPYSAYTETGLPWLGQIPATWKLRRAKYLFREVDERSRTGSEELLSVSHKTGVTPRSQKNVTMFMAESNVGHKVCRPDDLVINTLWAWMAALGVSRHHGMVSPAYGVYRPIDPSGFRPRFADQLLRTPFYAAEYQRCSTGVNSSRLRLYPEAFFRIPILMPPEEEQEAIVRFLAHANHKIDGFIRAKRKLIGLLNEQKQAIIHQAVTRGLDPSVPLKPSGIPWLGDIPKRWEARRLRFCIKGKLAYGANEAAEFDNPDWPRYLRITDFSSDGTLKSDTFRSLPPHIAKDYPVQDGDVLFARSGATVGKAFLVRTDTSNACYAGYLIRARPRPDAVLPEFLFAYTQSLAFAQWKDEIFSKATIQNIGADKYSNLVVPIPKIEEQQSILAQIALETHPLNTAIARTELEIALMQEYRTRLTADLVTGKLDVREAAAKLPEPPAEPATEGTLEEIETEELEA